MRNGNWRHRVPWKISSWCLLQNIIKGWTATNERFENTRPLPFLLPSSSLRLLALRVLSRSFCYSSCSVSPQILLWLITCLVRSRLNLGFEEVTLRLLRKTPSGICWSFTLTHRWQIYGLVWRRWTHCQRRKQRHFSEFKMRSSKSLRRPWRATWISRQWRRLGNT